MFKVRSIYIMIIAAVQPFSQTETNG